MNTIYELLNDAKMELEDYENQNLSDYEIHALKKQISKEIKTMNKKRLRCSKSVIAACLCTVLLFGAGTAGVVAGILPIPEAIKSVFGIDSTEQEESAASMGTAINISSVDNGYKITATGVLRDSKHVCISYRVEKEDGSILDGAGEKCTYAGFRNFKTNDSWMGSVENISNQIYTNYIDFYMILDYFEEKNDEYAKISADGLQISFPDKDKNIEIEGKWNFEIPVDIEYSSTDVAKGKMLKLGEEEIKLEEASISPMGLYLCFTSMVEIDDNELAEDSLLWIYLKNGETISWRTMVGNHTENEDGTWTYIRSGTFEKLIPLSSMDKIVFGDYEIKIE